VREISGESLDALTAGHGGRPPAEIERDLAIASLTQLRLLSAGSASSVFRAYQATTQRTVAVKVLHDELTSDVGQRFDRERAITGQLSGHSGIVPLFETGTTSDAEPYLVLPYYRRGSFADLTTRYGPLPWREATFLMRPVASTVAEVHGWSLVHRNLKPANILLTDFLRPRVADFGMCLPAGQLSTAATEVHGPYAAEETGVANPADPTMDVYGLGATFWALLAGRPIPAVEAERRRPGSDPTGSSVGRWSRRDAATVLGDETPQQLVELIERSLSVDPDDRPANAAAFVAELPSNVARPESSRSPSAGGRRRRMATTAPPSPKPSSQDLPRDLGGSDRWPREADPVTAEPNDDVPAATVGWVARSGWSWSTEVYLLTIVALIIIGIVTMTSAAILAFQ
jgi:serine/threonine protein kinase